MAKYNMELKLMFQFRKLLIKNRGEHSREEVEIKTSLIVTSDFSFKEKLLKLLKLLFKMLRFTMLLQNSDFSFIFDLLQ